MGSTHIHIRVQPAISGFNPHHPGSTRYLRVQPALSRNRQTLTPACHSPGLTAPVHAGIPGPSCSCTGRPTKHICTQSYVPNSPLCCTISGVIITQSPIHGRVSGITHLNTRIAQYGHLTEVFFFLPERSLIAPHQRPAVLRRIPSQTCSLSFFASLPLLSNPFESSHHAHALLQTRPPLDLFFDRVDFLIDFILLDHCRASPEHHVIFKGHR